MLPVLTGTTFPPTQAFTTRPPCVSTSQYSVEGRPISAPRAADWGLIAEAVPAADLDAIVAGYTDALIAAPPRPLGLARLGLDRSLDTPLDPFLQWEADAVARCLTSPEHRVRVSAFLEAKRTKAEPVASVRTPAPPDQ